MRKRYFIEIVNDDRLVVYCPASAIEGYSIKKIAFGSKAIEARFLPSAASENRIVISKKIKEALHFPDFKLRLHVFVENQTLYIGPLIGIFTAGFTPFPLRLLGDRTSFFAKLLSVKKSVGALPFIFGEKHIDWENGLIKGHFYDNDHWKVHIVPLPNVIYDRLPNRKSERNPLFMKIKDRLQNDYFIPWYNPGFFNKLDIFERLQQEISVEKYLPETFLFTSFSSIETMLSKYGHIFLKPINGSLGIGVHQIIYDKYLNDYYCRFQDQRGVNRLQKFSSLEGLFKSVFAKKNLGKMLVQQGIHLLRYNQRLVDFRIHTNKDRKGNWHISAIAAKMAGAGSVTTHVRSGGEIKTIEEIFSPEECGRYTEKLITASLDLSKALERNVEGVIGEIGFDLGIDRNGEVWLFEANSKPGRSIFNHPELKEFDLLTRKLTMDFAIFLTEQAIMYPKETIK